MRRIMNIKRRENIRSASPFAKCPLSPTEKFLASFPWKLLSKYLIFIETDSKTEFLILKWCQWHIICLYLGKQIPSSELIYDADQSFKFLNFFNSLDYTFNFNFYSIFHLHSAMWHLLVLSWVHLGATWPATRPPFSLGSSLSLIRSG